MSLYRSREPTVFWCSRCKFDHAGECEVRNVVTAASEVVAMTIGADSRGKPQQCLNCFGKLGTNTYVCESCCSLSGGYWNNMKFSELATAWSQGKRTFVFGAGGPVVSAPPVAQSQQGPPGVGTTWQAETSADGGSTWMSSSPHKFTVTAVVKGGSIVEIRSSGGSTHQYDAAHWTKVGMASPTSPKRLLRFV